MNAADDLTLVLDIGKSRAKLLMFDARGVVVDEHSRDNRSVVSSLGYAALDVAGLQRWIIDSLRASPLAKRCTRVIASTHGASFVALGDGSHESGLAWDPIDYEFEGVDDRRAVYQSERDDFDATLAPDLPAGLNAARQLFWMQRTHPEVWPRTRCLLPYPQFWAWWMSGVAASEVSSLGCHTQLWRPLEHRYSEMATRLGWASLFAPMAPAWRTLGTVRKEIAEATGLPESCEVCVGVHDSNACLARYLQAEDGQGATLVSTGTWIVVMSPDASATTLDPRRDMLANVSVRGRAVPTARFMGGREHEALCAGASPALANIDSVAALLRENVQALPSFARQGGPFASHTGQVLRQGASIDHRTMLDPTQRASLAALYCAQVTAYLLDRLGTSSPVAIEGPFAENAVYLQVLATLIAPRAIFTSGHAADGTARGAWALAHRFDGGDAGRSSHEAANEGVSSASNGAKLVAPATIEGLDSYQRRWLQSAAKTQQAI